VILELVQILDLRRRRANFISDEAKFAAVCGRYGENFNEFRNKICLMEPRIQNLNKLLKQIDKERWIRIAVELRIYFSFTYFEKKLG
jgi:hypothetical protein